MAAGALALVSPELSRARGPQLRADWTDPWNEADGFQLAGPWRRGLLLLVDGELAEALVQASPAGLSVTFEGAEAAAAGSARIVPVADGVLVLSGGVQTEVALPKPGRGTAEEAGGGGVVTSEVWHRRPA